MRHRFFDQAVLLGVAGVIATLACPGLSHALIIPAGQDNLQTLPGTPPPGMGTFFQGIQFQGVPLGPGTGPTDTIIQRLADAIGDPGGPPAVVPIQISALQLQSTTPVDLTPFGGTGTGTLFATLSPTSTQPLGSLTITFAQGATQSNLSGMFTAMLPEILVFRSGSVTGPILGPPVTFPGPLVTPIPVPWSGNFVPSVPWIEVFPAPPLPPTHLHFVVFIPEPSSLVMGTSAALIVLGYSRCLRRRKV